jgi:hypothetical protein
MYVNRKFVYRRSKKHLQNVASLPCQLCGVDGRTQAAHSNQLIHGKGRGIKASDVYVAALCDKCHYQIDQGKDMTKAERIHLWEVAFGRTLNLLVDFNLWNEEWEIPSEYRELQ